MVAVEFYALDDYEESLKSILFITVQSLSFILIPTNVRKLIFERDIIVLFLFS